MPRSFDTWKFSDWSISHTGKVYNDLLLTNLVAVVNRNAKYEYKCKCGNTGSAFLSNIISGRKKNCGKGRCEASYKVKHGASVPTSEWYYLYKVWQHLGNRKRCEAWQSFTVFRQWLCDLLGDKLTAQTRGISFGFRDNKRHPEHTPHNTVVFLKVGASYSAFAQPTA